MKNPLQHALIQAYERRAAYIEENRLEAFRLSDRFENPAGAAVDIYAGSAVVQLYSDPGGAAIEALADCLRQDFRIKDIFYKNRSREDLSYPPDAGEDAGEAVISEYGKKFIVNLRDYLDTGIFPDHREARRWAGEYSGGRAVLNTFAYTGSFSVYAACGGADTVFSVDVSRVYCDWIGKNFQLNGLSAESHPVYSMDVREFFKIARKKKLLFDLIIIDPPTFSRSKKGTFSVQRDHKELLEDAATLLAGGGTILFSNNYHGFKLDKSLFKRFKTEETSSRFATSDFREPDRISSFLLHN